MISITVKKGRVPSCSKNQKQKKEKFKALSNHSVSFPHSISVGRSSLRSLLRCSLQEHCTISYICAWISSNHTAADRIASIHQAYIIDFFACKKLDDGHPKKELYWSHFSIEPPTGDHTSCVLEFRWFPMFKVHRCSLSIPFGCNTR